MQQILFCDLGLMDFKTCWDFQETLFEDMLNKKMQARTNNTALQNPQHYLFFVEHPHVYTLGKSGKAEHLLAQPAFLKQIQATFYRINRGGDITYHGPGQLVGYPLLDLDFFFTDIHKYLRLLEETMILVLAHYGIYAGRRSGETGVWIDAEVAHKARKICAFGVRCSRWVTMHGWALNVNNDLSYFNHIVPCGIKDKGVTSMQAELGKPIDMDALKAQIKFQFGILFNAVLKTCTVGSINESLTKSL
jgi:lipoyl(octanoyl) transferase